MVVVKNIHIIHVIRDHNSLSWKEQIEIIRGINPLFFQTQASDLKFFGKLQYVLTCAKYRTLQKNKKKRNSKEMMGYLYTPFVLDKKKEHSEKK